MWAVLAVLGILGSRPFGRKQGVVDLLYDATEGRRCKVLVSDMDGWNRYVTREYYHWMNGLIVAHHWKSVEPWWIIDRSESEFAAQAMRVCGGTLPAFVLMVELYQVKLSTLAWLRRQGVRLGMWTNDANSFEERDLGVAARQALFGSLDVLFGPYTYLAHVFYPSLRYPDRVWQPNGLSLEMQDVPFNKAPLPRVYVSGATDKLHYPFRAWARDRAEAGDHRFVFLKHPGYGSENSRSTETDLDTLLGTLTPDKYEISATVKGRAYAQLMSKFLVCLTDLMRHTNLVAKHFEIPASGCLLLTSNQHPELLRAVGFVHMENCLLYDKSDPLPMIEWALNPRNRAKVDGMRAAGRALVLSQHLIQKRSSLVDTYVRGMLAQRPTQPWWHVQDMRRCTACPCPLAREAACHCAKQWQNVIHSTHPNGEKMQVADKRAMDAFCPAAVTQFVSKAHQQ